MEMDRESMDKVYTVQAKNLNQWFTTPTAPLAPAPPQTSRPRDAIDKVYSVQAKNLNQWFSTLTALVAPATLQTAPAAPAPPQNAPVASAPPQTAPVASAPPQTPPKAPATAQTAPTAPAPPQTSRRRESVEDPLNHQIAPQLQKDDLRHWLRARAARRTNGEPSQGGVQNRGTLTDPNLNGSASSGNSGNQSAWRWRERERRLELRRERSARGARRGVSRGQGRPVAGYKP